MSEESRLYRWAKLVTENKWLIMLILPLVGYGSYSASRDVQSVVKDVPHETVVQNDPIKEIHTIETVKEPTIIYRIDDKALNKALEMAEKRHIKDYH